MPEQELGLQSHIYQWLSRPHDDWKTKLKNPLGGTFVNGEYIPPAGMDIVTQYNLNKKSRWPQASYTDLLNLDKNLVLLNLHDQGNTVATNILSERLQESKDAEFKADTPRRIKELQKKYLESDLTWSDADSARDWYAVGATPEELKEWDEGAKFATKAGLMGLASIYTAPFLFRGLKHANKFVNLKTAAKLRNLGWNKTARALSDYGLTNAALDLGFTGNLAANVAKGNASTKDLMLDLGITGAIIGRKPLIKGMRWLGNSLINTNIGRKAVATGVGTIGLGVGSSVFGQPSVSSPMNNKFSVDYNTYNPDYNVYKLDYNTYKTDK